MSSWIGSWLAGGKAAAQPAADRPTDRQYRGARLGLPESGPGSLASMGRRLAALLVDLVVAALVTALFVRPQLLDPASMQAQNYWSVLAWFLITVIGTGFFGFTPGMGLLGIRVARLDGGNLLGPIRAIVRAVLIGLLVPAVIWDRDYRGLQDKAAGTIVIAMR